MCVSVSMAPSCSLYSSSATSFLTLIPVFLPSLLPPNTQVKKAGLQNILALRGDPPKGQENFTVVEGGFGSALDLVKYIK